MKGEFQKAAEQDRRALQRGRRFASLESSTRWICGFGAAAFVLGILLLGAAVLVFLLAWASGPESGEDASTAVVYLLAGGVQLLLSGAVLRGFGPGLRVLAEVAIDVSSLVESQDGVPE